MQRQKGSICVTEHGDVVMLTVLDRQGDMQNNGAIPVFDIATILRSRTYPIGSRWSGTEDSYRVVAHADDALRLLEAAGVDLSAHPDPDTEIERLRRRVEELERTAQTGVPASAIDVLPNLPK